MTTLSMNEPFVLSFTCIYHGYISKFLRTKTALRCRFGYFVMTATIQPKFPSTLLGINAVTAVHITLVLLLLLFFHNNRISQFTKHVFALWPNCCRASFNSSPRLVVYCVCPETFHRLFFLQCMEWTSWSWYLSH